MGRPRRVPSRLPVLHVVSGSRPPEVDPAAVVARRLSLPPPRGGEEWNKPWRYWLLRYLAALAAVADYEGQPFGRAEALAALETLHDDVAEVVNVLRRRAK